MSDYVTTKQLDAALDKQTKMLRTEIRGAVDDISEVVLNFANQVDERFTKVELRLDRLEKEFKELRLETQNSLNQLTNRIAKTGIPMPQL